MKKPGLLVLVLLILVVSAPVLYGFLYISQYGVSVPLDDQWGTTVPWTVKYYEARFNPVILITESQNDSRLLFPSLVMLGISIVTRMDIKALYYAAYLFYAVFVLLAAWLLFRDLKLPVPSFLLLLAPVLYYTFNPYYLFRFIYNVGSMQSLTILLALLTIILIDRSGNQNSERRADLFFGGSILLAVMCSFSGATGLMIWFAGLLQISLQAAAGKTRKILLWVASAAILFYTYYVALAFRTEGIHGTRGYSAYLLTAITYPANKFFCFMGVLGAEVVHDASMALFFGVLLTGIFLALLYNNRHATNPAITAKWYALLAFGSLTGLALALSRSGAVLLSDFGSPQTLLYVPEIRHSLYMFLPVICVYILTLLYTRDAQDDPALVSVQPFPTLERRAVNLLLLGMILLLILSGALLHILPGIAAAQESHDKNINNRFYLLNYRSESDTNLKQMYPYDTDARIIRYYAQKMEKLRLNVFADHQGIPIVLSLVIVPPDRKADTAGNILKPEYYTTSTAVRIGTSSLPAVFEHPQGEGSILAYYNYTIHPNTRLDFFTGMDEQTWQDPANDGVTFEIRMAENGTANETILFTRSMDPAHNPADRAWLSGSIALNNYTGRQEDILLITRPNLNAGFDWAWWGDPRIIESNGTG